MIESESNTILSLSHIIAAFLGALIAKILELFYPFIKEKIYDIEQKRCSFSDPGLKIEKIKGHKVLLTKKFNKVTNINCPWFNTLEKIKYQNGIFYYCPYGLLIKNIIEGKHIRCRHIKIKYQKLFKLAYRFKLLPKY